jgi:hypothetical protein
LQLRVVDQKNADAGARSQALDQQQQSIPVGFVADDDSNDRRHRLAGLGRLRR